MLPGSASAVTGGGGGGGWKGAKVERRGGAERGTSAADMFTAGAYISAHLIVGCGGSGVEGKLPPSVIDGERHSDGPKVDSNGRLEGWAHCIRNTPEPSMMKGKAAANSMTAMLQKPSFDRS